jgi:sarcosine oxidase subunit beta
MVRAQGGTSVAIRLGMWSRDFYLRQREEIGIDSGFVEQGYFMPVFDAAGVRAAQERLDLQRRAGLAEVRWLDPAEAEELNPTLATGSCLGGTYAPGDGFLDPPRNVTAYASALALTGVEVLEGVACTGLSDSGGAVSGVHTDRGTIATERVVLAGGPYLRELGRLCGLEIHSQRAPHQVAVTDQHPALAPEAFGPMVFDVAEGMYWRPEDGGVLFGMSNSDDLPGDAHQVDWPYLERIQSRLAELVPLSAGLPLRKVWAATIDFTVDHRPIVSPALTADGVIEGVTVAAAGGHGMMWGPAVARVAADVALGTDSGVLAPDLLDEISMARFDSDGHSRLTADPVAVTARDD